MATEASDSSRRTSALEFLALDSGAIESGSSSFTYASQGGVISFGIPLDPVAVGFRFRYFHVSSPQTAAGWSLDPALTVKIDFLRASLMYEGALTDEITWKDGTQESWEQGLAIGVAATLRPFEAVVCSAAFEADGLFSSSAGVCAGLETWVGGLGARAGYGTTGLTFGLSVAVFRLSAGLGVCHACRLGRQPSCFAVRSFLGT